MQGSLSLELRILMMTVPLDKLMQARKKMGNQYAYLEELEAASHVPADAIQT